MKNQPKDAEIRQFDGSGRKGTDKTLQKRFLGSSGREAFFFFQALCFGSPQDEYTRMPERALRNIDFSSHIFFRPSILTDLPIVRVDGSSYKKSMGEIVKKLFWSSVPIISRIPMTPKPHVIGEPQCQV